MIPWNDGTSNALLSLISGKRCVFKSRLKRSDSMAGSRNESGSEFQTVRPVTEKARRLCQMCCDETVEYSVCNGWPNGDFGGRKLQRLARSCRRGTLELGTEHTGEQSRLACTASAAPMPMVLQTVAPSSLYYGLLWSPACSLPCINGS